MRDTISDKVDELTSVISEDVREAIKSSTNDLENAEKNFHNELDEIIDELSEQRAKVSNSMRRFFNLENGFKQFIFWAGAIMNIATFGLMIYFSFIK